MLAWFITLFNRLFANNRPQASETDTEYSNIEKEELVLTDAVEEENLPEPTAPVAVEQEPGIENTFDKEKFFQSLRSSLFRRGLKTSQVVGIEAVLKDMSDRPASWIAYALATAYHETNKNMKPNTENMNYSVQGLINTFGRHRISLEDANRLGRKPGEGPLPVARQKAIANILYGGAWGRTNLGNTEPNDGWMFRGRGMDHCTGRRNYRVTGNDIGVDLIAKPDLLLVLENAVKALHLGMVTGRYVPGHTFARHLPASGVATRFQFREARRIINGVDKADLIAGYALDFQAALIAGGHNK